MADVAATASTTHAAHAANAAHYQRPRILPGGKDALSDPDNIVAFFAPTGNLWAQAVLAGQPTTAVAANGQTGNKGQTVAQAKPAAQTVPSQTVQGQTRGLPAQAGAVTGASGSTDGKALPVTVKPGLALPHATVGFASSSAAPATEAKQARSLFTTNPRSPAGNGAIPQLSSAAFGALIKATGATPAAATAAKTSRTTPRKAETTAQVSRHSNRRRITIMPTTARAGSTAPSAASANRTHRFPAHAIGQPSPRAVPLPIFPKQQTQAAMEHPKNYKEALNQMQSNLNKYQAMSLLGQNTAGNGIPNQSLRAFGQLDK